MDCRPAVGPFGPGHAPFGPDHASGPAALVPASRVPVQLGQDSAVDFRRDPVVELSRDPLIDIRADAFHQTLGQCLVIAGSKILQGGHRGSDLSWLSVAIMPSERPSTLAGTVRTSGREAEYG